MKTKTISLMLVILLVLATGAAYWYSELRQPHINCNGRVVWEVNDEMFKGDLDFQMQGGEGVVIVTGELVMHNDAHYKVSRIAYFTYQNVRDNYILHTNKLVRFPTDELLQTAWIRAMPPIYLTDDTTFSLVIKSWKEGWAFSTIGAPSLLCSDEE
ncbi:TPA: hypothetical protein ACG1JD_004477 [Citrobacter sedlakii]